MIEAVKFWNEPNNKSHWDPAVDPDWSQFARMVRLGAAAVEAQNPALTKVLGGMSPIDPAFVQRLKDFGALERLQAVAVHGFPLDWNHWRIEEWPEKIESIREVANLPAWVTEVGVSSFGAEEVQEWGLRKTAELLAGRAERIHWYSLYDLPGSWEATTRHKAAEGSSYYRHFHMGLLREDGAPKRALRHFSDYVPEMGICQWFHFEDHRLDDAVRWFRKLGVRRVRTGLSWADAFRPHSWDWFDRQMRALDEFEVTVTLCFTPEHLGVEPHHTSPPKNPEEFAEFCSWIVRRYAPGGAVHAPQAVVGAAAG